MSIIDFDPAILSTLYLRKNRGGVKHFTFTTPDPNPLNPPLPYSLAEYDSIVFNFKKGGKVLFSQTLAVSGVANNELDLILSDDLNYAPSRNYTWELVFEQNAIQQTWLTGAAIILADGETLESDAITDLTVILSSDEILITVSNIGGGGNTVTSVAGKTGVVVLVPGDITGLGTAATLNVGTGNNQIVQLTASAQLPAVSGINLIGIPYPVTSVAGRTGAIVLSTADVSGLAAVATTGAYANLSGTPTLGTAAALNWGTGANQLVRLNASAQLPAVSGINLTGVPYPVTSVAGRTGAIVLSTADVSGLAAVATTGAYANLSGTPTLGTAAALNVGISADNVVQLTASAQLPAVSGVNLTGIPYPVTSVAGRTGAVTLSAGDVSGLATVATTGAYSNLSGTPTLGTAAALNWGTGVNQLVRLNASAQLPAVSGVNLTGIPYPVASVAGRTGAIVLTTADVSGLGTAATLNVGTGNNQIVQLDGTARFPAIDGRNLINLPVPSTDIILLAMLVG